jgi:hypothetical protein
MCPSDSNISSRAAMLCCRLTEHRSWKAELDYCLEHIKSRDSARWFKPLSNLNHHHPHSTRSIPLSKRWLPAIFNHPPPSTAHKRLRWTPFPIERISSQCRALISRNCARYSPPFITHCHYMLMCTPGQPHQGKHAN